MAGSNARVGLVYEGECHPCERPVRRSIVRRPSNREQSIDVRCRECGSIVEATVELAKKLHGKGEVSV